MVCNGYKFECLMHQEIKTNSKKEFLKHLRDVDHKIIVSDVWGSCEACGIMFFAPDMSVTMGCSFCSFQEAEHIGEFHKIIYDPKGSYVDNANLICSKHLSAGEIDYQIPEVTA